MVGNSKSPMTTCDRGPSKLRELATALIPAEALGMTATSSRSAPIDAANRARRRSTCSTHISHGEPLSCHESRYSRNAASTSRESAPWEQLLTYTRLSKMGNRDRNSSKFIEHLPERGPETHDLGSRIVVDQGGPHRTRGERAEPRHQARRVHVAAPHSDLPRGESRRYGVRVVARHGKGDGRNALAETFLPGDAVHG